jgi:hypothetical protein
MQVALVAALDSRDGGEIEEMLAVYGEAVDATLALANL